MAGWGPAEIEAHRALVEANSKLPCSQPGCEGLRYFALQVCKAHSAERAERRRTAGQKASATKRARYPEKFYQPGEVRDFRWQAFAQNAVNRAKAAGLLPDLSKGEYACTDCGGTAEQYDHRDYSRPLDVEPVCRRCNHRRGKARHPAAADFNFQRLTVRDHASYSLACGRESGGTRRPGDSR